VCARYCLILIDLSVKSECTHVAWHRPFTRVNTVVIFTRATFRPHSCYWVINFSCYRPIIQRLEQSVRSNHIRAYNMHSGCRRTFKLVEIQYRFSISLLYGYSLCGAVEACWAHNPEVQGSKPRSANRFCISLTDWLLGIIPK
jgi:hypothetical protein